MHPTKPIRGPDSMLLKILLVISLLANVFLAVYCGRLRISEDTPHSVQAVFSPEKIGPLGVPMGDFVKVRGVVPDLRGRKGSGNSIDITEIDGRTVDPIRIAYVMNTFSMSPGMKRVLRLKEGHTYELIVYQSGRFSGTPEGFSEIVGFTIQDSGYCFQYFAIVCKARDLSVE